jgi:hypothetical protein
MSAATEVRAITRGSGATLTALVSGSMILAGRICRCAGKTVPWAWNQASIDTPATAAAQAKADKAAQTKAARTNKPKKAGTDEDQDEDEPEEPEEVKAPPVKPVRRPALESLAMLAFGGILAAGAAGTLGSAAWPYLQQLAPWRGVIAGVGGLAWMVAAWMVAPPPTADEEKNQEHEDVQDENEGLSPGDLLGRHVLEQLVELEKQDRPGLHVTALITSAEAAGILAPGAMDKTAMRAWLKATKLPVTKSVKVQGSVDYGVRLDRVREALGMGPVEALERAFGEAPASSAPAAPEEAAIEATGEPAPAPRLTLLQTLPDGGAQESAQGAA